MSVIRSLTALLKLDISDFSKNLPIVEKKNDTTQKKIRAENKKTSLSFKDISSSASLLKGALAGLITGAFLSGVANVTKGNEKIIASFNAVTHDTEQARIAFEEFNGLSRNMTQSFDDITQSVLSLGKTGIKPTTDFIQALGSIADGTGKSLMTVTDAVSNAILGQTKGLRQLGITAVQEGDKLRVTFKGNTQIIENNAKSIKNYIQDIAKSDFAGITETQMNGLTGAFKNLGDAWADFLFSFGDSGLGEVIKQGVWIAVEALDGLSSFINNNDWFAAITSDLASVMSDFRKDIKFVVSYFTEADDKIDEDSNSTWNSIKEYAGIYFSNFFSLVKIGATTFIAALDSLGTASYEFFKLFVTLASNSVSSISKMFSGLGNAVSGFISDILSGNFSGIGDRIGKSVSAGFSEGLKNLTKGVNFKAIADEITRPFEAVSELTKDLAAQSVANDKKRAEEKAKRDKARAEWNAAEDSITSSAAPNKKGGKAVSGKSVVEKDTWSHYYENLINTANKSASELEQLEYEHLSKLAEFNKIYNENRNVSEAEKNNALLIINEDYHNKRIALENKAKEFLASLNPINEELYKLEAENTEKLALLEEYHKDALISEEEYLAALADIRNRYDESKKKASEKRANEEIAKMQEPYAKMGEITTSLGDAFSDLSANMDKSSGAYKALFAVQKSFSVASATMDAMQLWIKAMNDPTAITWPQKLANYASAVAATMGIISRLTSVTMHDTGGHISAGEFGIVGEYGPELIRGPANITSRKDTANIRDSVVVNLYENPDRAGEVESIDDNESRIINIFVSDIRRGGEMSNVIQNTYNLKRVGI